MGKKLIFKLLILMLVLSIPVSAKDKNTDAKFVSSILATEFSVTITDGGSGMNFTGEIGQVAVTPSGQNGSDPWATISNGNSVQNFNMTYSAGVGMPSQLKVNNLNDIASSSLLNEGDTKPMPGGQNVSPNTDIKIFVWTTYSGTNIINNSIGTFVLNGTTIQMPAYYVAKNGNDNNLGTIDQPWLTISKAANTAKAGDIVYIRDGTYNEKVKIMNSGTSENYITFATYPGEIVNVDGTSLSLASNEGLLNIRGNNYIIIKGLNFKNSVGNGVKIDDNADHITINNNTFVGTFEASPIQIGFASTSNILIENNTINRNVGTCGSSCWAEMISVSKSTGPIVRYNHILYNDIGEGIDFKDGTNNGKIYGNIVENTKAVGIYLDARGDMRNFEIYDNIVHNTDGGIILATESDAAEYNGIASIQNVNIFNNIVYDANMGIRIAPWGDQIVGMGTIKDVKIVNNDFYNNTNGNDVGYFGKDTVQNITVRNNIFSKNGRFSVYNGTVAADHNTFDASNYCYGSSCIIGDPKFVSPGVDFHLQSGSIAIDSGIAEDAPSFDFDGNIRPKGLGYDIGAYER